MRLIGKISFKWIREENIKSAKKKQKNKQKKKEKKKNTEQMYSGPQPKGVKDSKVVGIKVLYI
jgi:hypothetical protein